MNPSAWGRLHMTAPTVRLQPTRAAQTFPGLGWEQFEAIDSAFATVPLMNFSRPRTAKQSHPGSGSRLMHHPSAPLALSFDGVRIGRHTQCHTR